VKFINISRYVQSSMVVSYKYQAYEVLLTEKWIRETNNNISLNIRYYHLRRLMRHATKREKKHFMHKT